MDNYIRRYGDDILPKDPRLKYSWDWVRSASGYKESELKDWTHFQSSSAKVGPWGLEAVAWGDGYEAVVLYVGNSITRGPRAKSRIKAQILAEKLLVDWITDHYNTIVISTELERISGLLDMILGCILGGPDENQKRLALKWIESAKRIANGSEISGDK